MKAKISKICISLIMAFSMIFGITNMNLVEAAGGTSINSATNITLGNTINDSITSSVKERYYKFTISTSGTVKWTYVKTSDLNIGFYIYDLDNKEIWSSYLYSSQDIKVDLTKGTYYLKAKQGSYTGSYTLKTSFVSAGESYTGDNGSWDKANTISLGNTIKGHIAENRKEDWYKFNVPTSGKVKLSYLKTSDLITEFYIYDLDNKEIWNSPYLYSSEDMQIDLTKGTYYLRARQGSYTGPYTLNTKFSFTEETPDVFVYTKNLSSLELHCYSVYGAHGYEIYRSTSKNGTYSKIATITNNNTVTYIDKGLTAGKTYYYKIASYINVGNGKIYSARSSSDYNKVSVSISKTSIKAGTKYTYKGSTIKPKVTVKYGNKTLKYGTDYTLSYKNNKNTGKATIMIKGKGNYTGSKTINFYIVPKKVTISSVKPGKKQFTVKYKKVTGASGYQIAYSTSKSKGFKYITVNSKTASKVIKKLKSKKNYYVKVRAYKTAGKKKYYGAYSNIKSVKVK